MIKVGIIGANGYLGVELMRILSVHPEVKLSKILVIILRKLMHVN